MSISCQIAEKSWQQSRLWLNLWNFLLFAFGLAVVVFCILSIFYFLKESWLPAAIGTVGTIAAGGGMAWVVAQRKTASEDELAARNLAIAQCQNVPRSASTIESTLGFESIRPSPSVDAAPVGTIDERMKHFEAKHSFFGRAR